MMSNMTCPEREKVTKTSNGLGCIDDRSGIILDTRRTSHCLSGVLNTIKSQLVDSNIDRNRYGQTGRFTDQKKDM